jgi:predicted metal-dependent phosphoesterase TrpH
MSRYDLQVHTDASPCSSTPPEEVVEAALEAELDGIAITDHDTMQNVSVVAEHAPSRLEVIPAVEVTTTQGHLLALGVEEPPSPDTDPLTAIVDTHRQGGVAVLSHPFDSLRQRYTNDLDAIADAVDGVEVINSRCVRERFNREASEFAERYEVAKTGGSDAHFPHEIGRAVTNCQGPVLDAIREGATVPDGRGRYLSGHVFTKINQARSRLQSL